MTKNNVERIQVDPLKSSIYLGIPIIVLLLLDTLYQVVDAYWINGIGEAAIISLGFIVNFTYAINRVGDGIGRASNVLISMEFGAKNYEKTHNIALHGMLLCLIVAIIMPLISLPFIKPVCEMAGISQYGELIFSYLLFPLLFIIFSVGCNFFSSIMGSEGDTKRATIIMVAGNSVNLILDPIFIYYLKMGMLGAGFATSIGFAISFALFIYLFYIKSDTLVKLNYSYFNFDWEILKGLINLAIPIIIESIIISLLGILINYALHLYAPPITAYAYVLIFRVQLVAFTPIHGLSKGFYTVIGHLFGAGKFVKMKKTIKKFLMITFSIALAVSAFLIIFNGQIISLFTSEFIVMDEVRNMLTFVILYTILHSIIHPACYTFLGLGKSKYLLYFIIYNLIIFAGCIFIFDHTLQMGSFGIFLSVLLSYFIELITILFLLNRHINRFIESSEVS